MNYPDDYGSDYDCVITVQYPLGSMTLERGSQLRIRMSESTPASWVLSIIDEDGTYCPDHRLLSNGSPNPWYGVLTQQPFAYDNTTHYARTMTATITHGGQTMTFSGVPTSRAHSVRWPDGKIHTTWAGVDKSHVLFRENQSMAAIRNGSSSTSAMAQVCSTYGLSFHPGNVPTDIPVPVQQRVKEKPIKWITDLLSVPVGEWYCDESGTIHVYIPGGTPVDTFDLSQDWITEVDDECSEVGFSFNRVVSTRATEVSAIIQGTLQQVSTYQQYDVQLPQVVTNLRWDVLNGFNGVFSDFIGYLNGEAVAGSQARVAGYVMNGVVIDAIDHASSGSWSLIDQVKFTWGPPVTYTTLQAQTISESSAAFGVIRFRGSDPAMQSWGSQSLWEYSDPPVSLNGTGVGIAAVGNGYRVTLNGAVVATVATEIDAHAIGSSLIGDHPKILEPNPLIPNDTWLMANAQRIRRRLMRDSVRTRLKMPLRLDVRPGQMYQYVNPRAGIDRTMYVTDVEHSIARDWGQRSTTVSLVQYPVF